MNPLNSLLVINSSAAREGSVSRELVEYTVDRLVQGSPDAKVVRRDLGANPVPHLDVNTLNGVRGTPSTVIEQAARKLSDELIAELRAADTLVIGAPMYNFGVTTSLRAWFDHVLRAGETFSYSAEGPRGLLGGKRVIVIESRGGLYSEGPAARHRFPGAVPATPAGLRRDQRRDLRARRESRLRAGGARGSAGRRPRRDRCARRGRSGESGLGNPSGEWPGPRACVDPASPARESACAR